MKQRLIKITDNHYVVVDDSEIKEGDWYENNRVIFKSGDLFDYGNTPNQNKKIISSTQPIETFNWMGNSEKGYDTIKPLSLQEVKELIGEIDKFELFLDREVELGLSPKDIIERIKWYYQKYFKEDKKEKKYTEEDMRNAILIGMKTGYHPEYHIESANRIIQSLQPKTEWEVEFDENGKLKKS